MTCFCGKPAVLGFQLLMRDYERLLMLYLSLLQFTEVLSLCYVHYNNSHFYIVQEVLLQSPTMGPRLNILHTSVFHRNKRFLISDFLFSVAYSR